MFGIHCKRVNLSERKTFRDTFSWDVLDEPCDDFTTFSVDNDAGSGQIKKED